MAQHPLPYAVVARMDITGTELAGAIVAAAMAGLTPTLHYTPSDITPGALPMRVTIVLTIPNPEAQAEAQAGEIAT
jgi:hypothetical protein